MSKLTINWQRQSQLSEDSMHSLLISLLRGLAALQVAVAHLRAEMFPSLRSVADPTLYYQGLAFVTGFAHQAVVVFFLISGWLVGGSLLNKIGQPQALHSYAIDRLTRMWTVLIPTSLLMLLIGWVVGQVEPAVMDFSTDNDFSVLSFLGNLLGLQTVVVKNFGGNYSLWSLANEMWYYVQFPLLLLVLLGRGPWRQACAAAALALTAAFLPFAITLYFALWLLGAAFSRIRIDCGTTLRIIVLAVAAGILAYYRFFGSNDDLVPASFVQDVICSLPILLLLSSLQMKIDPASRPLRRAGAVAKFFSDFSFTLYVMHVPMIILLRHAGRTWFGRDRLAPDAPLDYAIYLGMAALIVASAYLVYLLSEAHTFRVRRIVKKLLLERGSNKTAVAVVPGQATAQQ
jgi:peptidoglycan/LPS O-acetylase OafA/YrhL